MKSNNENLIDYIKNSFFNGVDFDYAVNEDLLTVDSELDSLLSFLTFLKDDARCQYKQLIDVTAVDYPENEKRFEIIYNLLSIKYNSRIIVRVRVSENELVPTACGVFSSANWYEREVWDMYGIAFSDHPDLRRILSDYGFNGYPLRKDFPLSGYTQVRYDDNKKQVIQEPVKLDQEYRSFDFVSPWEGTQYVLPGDEKASEA